METMAGGGLCLKKPVRTPLCRTDRVDRVHFSLVIGIGNVSECASTAWFWYRSWNQPFWRIPDPQHHKGTRRKKESLISCITMGLVPSVDGLSAKYRFNLFRADDGALSEMPGGRAPSFQHLSVGEALASAPPGAGEQRRGQVSLADKSQKRPAREPRY